MNKASLEHLNLMEKRIEFLIGARTKNRNKMQSAAKNIKKLSRKVKNWDSVEEIRKMRSKR